ncbi:hypothetical protein D3C80_686360 [compost metagenome]
MRAAQDLDALQVEQRAAACHRCIEVDVVGVDAHRVDGGGAGVTGAQAADVPARAAVAVGVLRRGVGDEGGDIAHGANAVGGDASALHGSDRNRYFLQGFFAVLGGDRDGLQSRCAAGAVLGPEQFRLAGQEDAQADAFGDWVKCVHAAGLPGCAVEGDRAGFVPCL